MLMQKHATYAIGILIIKKRVHTIKTLRKFFFLIFILILLTSYIKKNKFILNKHKSQLKFLYKNATLCIFIRTLPPTQNELIERKTIACVWELRHFSFLFFKQRFVQKPSIFHRTFSVCLCFFEQYLFQCYRFSLFSFLMIEGLVFYSFYPCKCTT